MPVAAYTPDRGDMIWVDLYPRTGHEQSGRRPVLVLSPKSYNKKTGLCIVCPATRQAKGYAFEVSVTTSSTERSVILADHVRNIDWKARKAKFFVKVQPGVLEEAIAKLEALIRPN
jgi:mRNA interferase MazF